MQHGRAIVNEWCAPGLLELAGCRTGADELGGLRAVVAGLCGLVPDFFFLIFFFSVSCDSLVFLLCAAPLSGFCPRRLVLSSGHPVGTMGLCSREAPTWPSMLILHLL